MESFVTCAVPALLTVLLVRAMLLPLKGIIKVAAYSAGGFLCLWVLNTVSGFTGICLPVNAVTVLIAGLCGVPGIGLITLLELV